MSDIFWKVRDFLVGKKTYIVLAVAVVLVLLQDWGVMTVPQQVWEILGLIGGATVTAKINRLIEALR